MAHSRVPGQPEFHRTLKQKLGPFVVDAEGDRPTEK